MVLALSGTAAAVAALAVAVLMLVAFVVDRQPPAVVAVVGAAVVVLLGFAPVETTLQVFANPAPWTIAGMFIVVGALVRTGALDVAGRLAARYGRQRPRLTLAVLAIVVVGLSGFLNNTPLVVVMMPVFMQLARTLSVGPSKLLIPLSYFSILGGTLTMLGTSTNLVVDGVWAAHGLGHLGLFDITPMGLVMATVGLIYLALFANRLLPDRTPQVMVNALREKREFLSEIVVAPDSSLIGKKLADVDFLHAPGLECIDLIRGYDSWRWNLSAVTIAAGDRIVVRSPMQAMLELKSRRDVQGGQQISSVEMAVVETLISPAGRMVGRTMGSLHLRRRYGVYVIAVHRHQHNHPMGRLRDLVVEVGDVLLLAGRPADIARLTDDMELTNVVEPPERPFRRRHAPIVVGCLLLVVIMSALNVAPILALIIIAVAVVLITGCIDVTEALSFVDGKLMLLLIGMLIVGTGLAESGGLQLLVSIIEPLLMNAPPWLVVALIYLVASALTELVTNNAVAAMLTPLVIVLAGSLHVDPKPLVMAVMLGASASFATPIGYQTNTLVYGPGGYRFGDFARIGLPLHAVMVVVVAVTIPLLWPLTPQ